MKKIFALLIASALVWGCSDNGKNIIAEESGTIESTDVIISSQTAGRIMKMNADEGYEVKKGDTLLIADTELYELQLRQAIAGRDIAKAQLDLLIKGARKEDVAQAREIYNQASANLTLAETDKKRMEALYEVRSISKKQLDDATLRYDVSASQFNAAKQNLSKIENIARPEEIAQAKGNLEKAEAGIELLKKNIRDCYVVSPIDGIVVKRFVEQGETVGMMSSLFKVSNLKRVEVVIYVSEKSLPEIKLNQTAEIATDGEPDKVRTGKVIFISPEAEFTPKNIQTKEERTKQVFAVKIAIDNPDGALKTGLPVDVKIKR